MKKLGLILISIFSALVAFQILVLKPEKFETTDIYDDIMNRGYLKVGINTDSKPFGFIDEKGVVAGYDVDLAKHIARYLVNDSQKVKFYPVTPSNRLIKVSTGEVDIVIATMTITPQREQIIDFSVPYDSAGMAILVKSSSKICNITDLSDQNVGIIWGTTAEKTMLNLVPTAHLIGYRSYHEAYKALKNGEVNAITSDDTILSRFVIEDNEVKMLPKRYTKEPYGIGIKEGKGSAKLKNAIDFAINDMKQKNIINRLHKQWLG